MRENNARQLRLLTIHEAVPGHYLQLAYANRFGQEIWRECQDPFHLQAWWAWSGAVG